jgi:hypothetical protein
VEASYGLTGKTVGHHGMQTQVDYWWAEAMTPPAMEPGNERLIRNCRRGPVACRRTEKKTRKEARQEAKSWAISRGPSPS